MTNRHSLMIAALLSAAALSGCARSDDEPAAVENGVTEDNRTTQDVPEPTPLPAEPEPSPSPIENTVAELPPAEAIAPDEQMMDDAAATGMTARRAQREPAGDDEAPVEPADEQ